MRISGPINANNAPQPANITRLLLAACAVDAYDIYYILKYKEQSVVNTL